MNIYDNLDSNGDSPWSPYSQGNDLTFNGNTVNVTIQYLEPSDILTELTDPNHAPELVPSGETDYPEPKDFFKITSEGTTGEARRKIEAIYVTEDIGVPKGYYTPNDIEVKGSACIDSVSLFTLGNVKFSGGGNGCDGTGENMKGEDNAYGNWYNPPFNTTARTDPTYGTKAGVGAKGTITGSNRLGTRDFHGSSTNPTNPKFIQKDPPDGSQASNEISFPFDYALPDIDFLRDEALKQEAETGQNHYIEVNSTSDSVTTWPTPPAGSDPARTVVYYKFMTPNGSNNLKWDVGSNCSDTPVEGTLVIESGNFTTTQHTTPLMGAVVIRGGESTEEGASTDTGGNTCLQGFVNASGSIKIAGSVTPMTPADLADKRPGFYGVELWSWRELYQ